MSDSVTDTISTMLAPILADLKLELYDLDFINSDVDLPWVWLQNDD